MARHPRLVVPSIALHVVQRGVDRDDCFRQDTDRQVYLSLLREFAKATECAIHAYCLMTNHVHLLLTPNDSKGPASLMYRLGHRYVPYFNRRYGRTGTLWEGRFRSCLVDSARYVLACYRYIELNPVRAAMAQTPETYAWSSHRVNVGLGEDVLVTPHPEYLALAAERTEAHFGYRALFDAGADPAAMKAIREATHGGYPLVGEALKARLSNARRPLQRRKPGPRSSGTIPVLDPN